MEKKNVRLIEPNDMYLLSYLAACQGFKRHHVNLYSLHDPDDFDMWRHTIFDDFRNQSQGIGLPEGYVPATTFWMVQGDEWIGVGNIRHRLTDQLERFGGHIGYAIHCDAWGMGYATMLLHLLLEQAAMLGITSALLTCDAENIASERVMQKNGGKYLDTIDTLIDGINHHTRRYRIETPPHRPK